MIKRILKQVLMIPIWILRRHKAKNALIKLTSHEDPTLRAIGLTLKESLFKSLTPVEQEAIGLIEQRRSFLLKSDKSINVIDYGAGIPISKRTKEEMERGIKSADKVHDITQASIRQFWAIILFKMIRKLKPVSCLELGTGAGISAAYQALALRFNGKGTLVTLEGSPEIAKIANETFESLGITNTSVITGPFHITLSEVLEASSPVDFFLNDGHHDHNAVINYFNQVMPFLSDGAVIVMDDISWSDGMKKAWIMIEDDKRVSASINLGTIGIVIIKKTLKTKVNFKIPL